MKKAARKKKKRKRLKDVCIICWIILPLAITVALILDGLGLYPFNTARLLVIGVCILVMLVPFFSEITVKSISLKKEPPQK